MRVFNTLSGRKEDFVPRGDEVKMYVCGVTPYDDAHIGHAMSYIIFDVVRRYLQFRGHKVKYVQNVTDIDDKLIDRSNRRGIPIKELAEQYTRSFLEDMAALNVARADFYPRATEEIPKIIEVIQGLVDRGHAYPAEGSVYFRVRSVADYGELSRRSLEQMMAGARIEAGEEKENPMDFVLWKASKPDEPSWDSPWGKGRPGWHIECSAMSLKYLGETLDIHGGGQDLVFPHHENEIAQSEGFTGVRPFVRYWLHNGLLKLGEEKMSKSLGNLITIREALAKYSADAVRLFVLSSHYRSPLTYSEEALVAAEKGADRLRQAVQGEETGDGADKWENGADYDNRFNKVMDDDFNTARAIALLFNLAREINQAREAGYSAGRARQWLTERAAVLGLTLKLPDKTITIDFANRVITATNKIIGLASATKLGITAAALKNTLDDLSAANTYLTEQTRASNPDPAILSSATASNIGSTISLREQLRQAKQWQLADEIRAELYATGIVLEDTPEGTVPKYKI